jgi:hypothetical protein
MTLTTTQAIEELTGFLTRCREHSDDWGRTEEATPEVRALHDEIVRRLPAVRGIMDQVWPDWRAHVPQRVSFDWQYDPLCHVAQHAVVLLRQREQLERELTALGMPAPGAAAALHGEVSAATRRRWEQGDYAGAVLAASERVRAKLAAELPGRALSAPEALYGLTALSVLARWLDQLSGQPGPGQPRRDDPAAGQPPAARPSADRPSAYRPSADRPGTDRPAGDQTSPARP